LLKYLLIVVVVALTVAIMTYPVQLAAKKAGALNSSAQACALAVALITILNWILALYVPLPGVAGQLVALMLSVAAAAVIFMAIFRVTGLKGALLALIDFVTFGAVLLFLTVV
jgi:hypothetical protein